MTLPYSTDERFIMARALKDESEHLRTVASKLLDQIVADWKPYDPQVGDWVWVMHKHGYKGNDKANAYEVIAKTSKVVYTRPVENIYIENHYGEGRVVNSTDYFFHPVGEDSWRTRPPYPIDSGMFNL